MSDFFGDRDVASVCKRKFLVGENKVFLPPKLYTLVLCAAGIKCVRTGSVAET